MTPSRNLTAAVRSVLSDVTEGFLEIIHNSLALLGIAVVLTLITLTARPDWREDGEEKLRAWLLQRQEALEDNTAMAALNAEPDAIERTTAANPQDLPREQAAIAYWLSKKYKVAAEPMAALVMEAYEQGLRHKIDPALILAVVAIESRFNPFAQSSVGAQGLMQVMTRVHTDKYEHFGGNLAAFDPVSNMRVGVSILKEYIRRAGSVEGGLKYYVGAANMPSDGGYAAKVLAEHRRILQVIGKLPPQPSPCLPLPIWRPLPPARRRWPWPMCPVPILRPSAISDPPAVRRRRPGRARRPPPSHSGLESRSTRLAIGKGRAVSCALC